MLKQRVVTALILAIFFFTAVFLLPPSAWSVLVALVVMQGAWEWSKLAKMKGFSAGGFLAVMMMSILAVALMSVILHAQQKYPLQIFIYGVAAVFWLIVVPLWFKNHWKIDNLWLFGFVGWIVLIPTGMAMLDLRAGLPQPWLLLGVMGMVWVADISAYFAGRKFGKNKLAPNISPGKTWEGVAGAMLGVMVYVASIMLGSGMTQRYSIFLFAIVGVALSVIGDLFESAIKRQAGVKDSGTLLPGHGGLLDRIDALTSTLPLAALALILMRFA
jgi:phosphatidate cytidylyltransferase